MVGSLGKILIVDDEDSVQKLLSVALESLGYTTLVAENGDDAVVLAQRERPDLVLMDVVMPGISGFEACKRLKSDPRTWWIPVIILSALDREVDHELGSSAGADGYITKPIRLSALRSIVERQLEASSTSRFSRRLKVDFRDRVLGRKILFEFDPTTDYEILVKDFISEAQDNGLKVIVLNFSEFFPFKADSFDLIDMRRMDQSRSFLTNLLEQYSLKPLGIIAFTLTDLLLIKGFKYSYHFVREALLLLDKNGVTALYLLAPKAHEEREVTSFRTLFKTQMRYEDGRTWFVKW